MKLGISARGELSRENVRHNFSEADLYRLSYKLHHRTMFFKALEALSKLRESEA